MKKVLLVAALVYSAVAVQAQSTGGTTFGIGANVGTGTKANLSTSYGVDGQVEIPVGMPVKLTASAGYQNFGVKVGEDVSFVPLLAGGKFNLAKGIYLHPQLGYSFLTNKVAGSNQNNGEFTYAASVGYGFGKHFDAGIKYLSVDAANAVLLRIGYNF
ncbi:outer membrane beta-barrel protein [Aridibaculum aurantiacum]|uniref:outer membrane beta-barrel protein n=1 Tax=Aridibaculum aurantiacum TaxID=2810307 RepID=UPI001A96CBF7|nr:outer membrane beta-barrel protein [Aridibaculum aurantiacum]